MKAIVTAALLLCALGLLASCTGSRGGPAQEAATSSYSTSATPISTLMADPEARAVLDRIVPKIAQSTRLGLLQGTTLRDIQPYAIDVLPEATLVEIDRELARLTPSAAPSQAAMPSQGSSAAPDCTHVTVTPVPLTLAGAQSEVYRRVGDRELRIHLFEPQGRGPKPAVLLFFGGGFMRGDAGSMVPIAESFVERGYVAAVADYRVYCRDQVRPDAGAEDALAAYEWLRNHAADYAIDVQRIVVSGSSAGGFLAIQVGLRADREHLPSALVLFNPFVGERNTLQQFMTQEEASELSPETLSMEALPPTIAFHGTADATVPIDTVRSFCARAVSEQRVCKVKEYEGMGHSFTYRRDVVPSLGVVPFDDIMMRAGDFLRNPVAPSAL